MATFVQVRVGGVSGWYVNIDLVRFISPSATGSVLYFDKEHTLGVSGPPDLIATAFGKGDDKKK